MADEAFEAQDRGVDAALWVEQHPVFVQPLDDGAGVRNGAARGADVEQLQFGTRLIAADAERQQGAAVQEVEKRQSIRLVHGGQFDLEVQLGVGIQRGNRELEVISSKVSDGVAVNGFHAGRLICDAEGDGGFRREGAVRQRDFHRRFAVDHDDAGLAAARRCCDSCVAIEVQVNVASNVSAARRKRPRASGFQSYVAGDVERARRDGRVAVVCDRHVSSNRRNAAEVNYQSAGVAFDGDGSSAMQATS